MATLWRFESSPGHQATDSEKAGFRAGFFICCESCHESARNPPALCPNCRSRRIPATLLRPSVARHSAINKRGMLQPALITAGRRAALQVGTRAGRDTPTSKAPGTNAAHFRQACATNAQTRRSSARIPGAAAPPGRQIHCADVRERFSSYHPSADVRGAQADRPAKTGQARTTSAAAAFAAPAAWRRANAREQQARKGCNLLQGLRVKSPERMPHNNYSPRRN